MDGYIRHSILTLFKNKSTYETRSDSLRLDEEMEKFMAVTSVAPDFRLPPRIGGTPLKPHAFTTAEINRKVEQYLTVNLSNIRNCILELLYHFVILLETTLFHLVGQQIAISENIGAFTRRLRQYRADGLLVSASHDVLKSAVRAGLPISDNSRLRAYCLGPIGEEYVKRKGWNGNVPISSTNEDVLAHDLLCAEAMLRMSSMWLTHPTSPGVVEVRGPRQLIAWDIEQRKTIVAPDGLLIKRNLKGDFERAFVVEYQNVRALLQVQNKLKKYEEIASTEYRWVLGDIWGLDEMPWVLIIYRQGATLQHIQEEIARRGEMVARFAAIALEDVWAGRLFIRPIRGNR
jgi:hypothetical protein